MFRVFTSVILSWSKDQFPSFPHLFGNALAEAIYCRSRSRARKGVGHRLMAATIQREIKFREAQETFPSETWERGGKSCLTELILPHECATSSR